MILRYDLYRINHGMAEKNIQAVADHRLTLYFYILFRNIPAQTGTRPASQYNRYIHNLCPLFCALSFSLFFLLFCVYYAAFNVLSLVSYALFVICRPVPRRHMLPVPPRKHGFHAMSPHKALLSQREALSRAQNRLSPSVQTSGSCPPRRHRPNIP